MLIFLCHKIHEESNMSYNVGHTTLKRYDDDTEIHIHGLAYETLLTCIASIVLA